MRASTGVPVTTGPISALAPAKVNLCLHVTGRRPDGYHLLETLVVFADEAAADRLSADHAGRDRFVVEGPAAGELDDADDNLVLRARDWLQRRVDAHSPAAITLEKHLPVASGLGGGSADAGATLRLLARLWGAPDAITARAREAICAELGADIAMCIESRALIARGIGEDLTLVDGLPPLPAVLVNPGVPLATPAVFGALRSRTNAAMPALPEAGFAGAGALARWLATNTRNDLEEPARMLAPTIDAVLDALAETRPALTRMSGSGATCFALYGDMDAARAAAEELAAVHDDWWVRPALLNPQAEVPLASEGAFRVRA
ncbi:MAG: 4-(cytidine 5'-diphospho)-2-C-methyl-D-erythritol kinase [Roseitalea porphyridii]|uniref:4-(cytidine 5'-diphospho)-2-C-methyl-D-erythritol kinase n=1 Tax=Roseitalea porphyridii TaxID=1852022 RepID=UPI0032ED645F